MRPYRVSEILHPKKVLRKGDCQSAEEEHAVQQSTEYCHWAPKAVLENPHAYHHMLARDAVTGSFSDYQEHFGRERQRQKKSSKLRLRRHSTSGSSISSSSSIS